MDLLTAIQLNTAAVRELNENIRLLTDSFSHGTPDDAPTVTAPISEPLTYETHVKPVAQRYLAAEGRDAFAEVLKEFGVASAKELRADQFADFIRVCV